MREPKGWSPHRKETEGGEMSCKVFGDFPAHHLREEVFQNGCAIALKTQKLKIWIVGKILDSL